MITFDRDNSYSNESCIVLVVDHTLTVYLFLFIELMALTRRRTW